MSANVPARTNLATISTRGPVANRACHPEPCEGSIMTCAGDHPDGSFARLRMTVAMVWNGWEVRVTGGSEVGACLDATVATKHVSTRRS